MSSSSGGASRWRQQKAAALAVVAAVAGGASCRQFEDQDAQLTARSGQQWLCSMAQGGRGSREDLQELYVAAGALQVTPVC
jgi:hypothetical protein